MSSSAERVQVIIHNSRMEGLAPPMSSEESFRRIASDQQRMEEIRERLSAVIDGMRHDPSRLSQAADYWGGIPVGLRIFAGVAVSGSFFLLGVITHIGVLFTLSIISALVYCACSILLEEHWAINNHTREQLKETMLPLAGMLESIIGSLHQVQSQLSSEVNRLL